MIILAVDTETTGLDAHHGCRPFIVSACDGENTWLWQGEVNPYSRQVFWGEEDLEEIQTLLNAADIILFHNTTFDFRMLESIGIDLFDLWSKVHDTLIASHLVCSGDSHGLKDLAIKYLHYWDDDEQLLDIAVQNARVANRDYRIAKEGDPQFPGLKGASVRWHKMDMWLAIDECITYALGDVERTWLLWREFKAYIVQENLWSLYLIRRKLLQITYDMETEGIYFYKEKAQKFLNSAANKKEILRKQIKQEAGINWKLDLSKKTHLCSLIHNHLKIPIDRKTDGGSPSMTKDTINYYQTKYDHPALETLKEYRKLETKENYITSYALWCDEHSIIHSKLNITGTRETRQSSNSPNMQNIDRTSRMFFGPPPEYIWIDIDLKNIELCIWAHETGNKELIDAFAANISIHHLIVDTLYDLVLSHGSKRQKEEYPLFKSNLAAFSETKSYASNKGGTFAWIYGGGDKKINQTYFDTSSKKPPNGTGLIKSRFPGVQQFIAQTAKEVEDNANFRTAPSIVCRGGYPLEVNINKAYTGTNYRIQGAAGFIITLAMIRLYEDPNIQKYLIRMIQQVHDSLVLQIPIQPNLDLIIDGCVHHITEAGKHIVPYKASYKIKTNLDDKENPLLIGLV